MLKEVFIASVLGSEKGAGNNTSSTKDVGIYIQEYQPLPSIKSTFKKSSTRPNCLAVSPTHIFAAQADKAIVNVYSRERGNQEAIVPFPERISSLAYIGGTHGPGVLALGTEGGRVHLWELCTGRLISTPPSHLQGTTSMAVDSTSSFLLTGSGDSNIHVWSISVLLSFASPLEHDSNQSARYSPLRTLSNHRAAITALVTGHSHADMDFVISGSRDNTCIVWDYRTGALLHTFLLSSPPLCLAIDPADRAFYAGFDDGSIQMIDFYKRPLLLLPLHDPNLSTVPTQPPPSDRWSAPMVSGSATLALSLSYDGTTLLAGHANGKISTWDTKKGLSSPSKLNHLVGSITNLQMLPPTGFPNLSKPPSKVVTVIKPRYEILMVPNTAGSLSPNNYTFTAQFASTLQTPRFEKISTEVLLTDFDAALKHSSFPISIIEEGITALFKPMRPIANDEDNTPAELVNLRAQLAETREAERVAMEKVAAAETEVRRREQVENNRRRAKRIKRIRRAMQEEIKRKKYMGEQVSSDHEMVEDEELQQASSSTDEMVDGD